MKRIANADDRAIELRKEARESWKGVVSDEIVEAQQFFGERRSSCWPFLSERYAKGDLWIEMFLRLRVDGEIQEYLALVESALSESEVPPGGGWAHREAGHISSRTENGDTRVFVRNPQEVQDCERMFAVVPSMVRLKFLDFPNGVSVNTTEAIRDLSLEPNLWITRSGEISNRKMDVGVFDSLCGGSQLPNNVIQRRTEIVNELTDPDTDASARLVIDMRDVEIAHIFHVKLTDRDVRFTHQEPRNFVLESVQLILRPHDLEARTV